MNEWTSPRGKTLPTLLLLFSYSYHFLTKKGLFWSERDFKGRLRRGRGWRGRRRKHYVGNSTIALFVLEYSTRVILFGFVWIGTNRHLIWTEKEIWFTRGVCMSSCCAHCLSWSQKLLLYPARIGFRLRGGRGWEWGNDINPWTVWAEPDTVMLERFWVANLV